MELEYTTIHTPLESVHTKGITLNSQNAEKIHYESMKQLIQNRDDVVTAVGTALKRERVKGTDEMTIRSLRAEERQKIVRFTATKRNPTPKLRHLPGFTVPRGYGS